MAALTRHARWAGYLWCCLLCQADFPAWQRDADGRCPDCQERCAASHAKVQAALACRKHEATAAR